MSTNTPDIQPIAKQPTDPAEQRHLFLLLDLTQPDPLAQIIGGYSSRQSLLIAVAITGA